MNVDSPNNPPATPKIDDRLAVALRNLELDLRVASPAHVTAYDPATQRVTVQLGAIPVRIVEGEEVPQAPIAIPNVPVVWLGGSLGYVTTPLVPDDTGFVVFMDRSISAWLLAGAPVDPVAGWTHALGDAVFLPGLRPVAGTIAPPTSLAATVVEGPVVHAGPGAANPVVKFQELSTAFGIWAGTIAGATSTLAGVPPAVDPATTLALANALAVWAAAVGGAHAALAAAVAGFASAKLMVQS